LVIYFEVDLQWQSKTQPTRDVNHAKQRPSHHCSGLPEKELTPQRNRVGERMQCILRDSWKCVETDRTWKRLLGVRRRAGGE
jgi:hypothetical protein